MYHSEMCTPDNLGCPFSCHCVLSKNGEWEWEWEKIRIPILYQLGQSVYCTIYKSYKLGSNIFLYFFWL